MLIEFTVGNFRSFKDPVTISLEATKITSKNKELDANNIILVNKRLSLLTSAVVYGANASGKSNLTSAIGFMRSFVMNSARESQAEDPIQVNTFRLSTATENLPAYFEIVFLIENKRYRYGFEVSREKVEREWLYYTPTIREAELFVRVGDDIKSNQRAFREGRGVEEKTRSNALFLSVVGQFNGPIAKRILMWFRRIQFVSGLEDTAYGGYTIGEFLEDVQLKKEIRDLVHSLDLGIEEILLERLEPEKIKFPKGMPDDLKDLILKDPEHVISIRTAHTKYDADGFPIGNEFLDLHQEESEGTKKLFFLSGPILDTLREGKILVIDEMEARMHPLITCAIINLFNSLETNPKRAQLIFTTHDTNLLDKNLFRRDQIWFVEKDSFGASHLYSLVEFKPRNDESFEKNYLRGKYGAVPYLGDLNRIFEASSKYNVKEDSNGA